MKDSALTAIARILVSEYMDRGQSYEYLRNLQLLMSKEGFSEDETAKAIKEHESHRRVAVRHRDAKESMADEVHGKEALEQWYLDTTTRRPENPIDQRNEWMLQEYGGPTPIVKIWEEVNRKWPEYRLGHHDQVVPTLKRYCKRWGKLFPHRRRGPTKSN